MNAISVPKEAVTIYNNALNLSNRGNYDAAIGEYKKAIRMYPGFIEAYNNIGEIYSRTGKNDVAITTYLEALKISRNYKVLLNLGVEYYNNNDFRIALKFFNESLSFKPSFLEGNYYCAMVYYNLKDYKKAEKHFLTVINQDRQHLKANYILSYIYYEWKEYSKAVSCLDNIKDICEDKLFINKYYGFCYYYMGRYDDAVNYLSVALESRPQYAKFKDYLESLTYENKIKEIGDIDSEIIKLENEAMENAPGIHDVTRLSMLYIFKGENKKAEKLLISARDKIAS